jgi:ABC-type xylose transport system permease subunit
MAYYIVKVFITAILVVLISEISKRSSLIGAILASLPIVSILAFIWLYIDTKSVEKISELSIGIFWLVIPSLSLFLVLPLLLKSKVNFYASLIISCAIMVLLYFIMVFILKRLNINL